MPKLYMLQKRAMDYEREVYEATYEVPMTLRELFKYGYNMVLLLEDNFKTRDLGYDAKSFKDYGVKDVKLKTVVKVIEVLVDPEAYTYCLVRLVKED